MDWDSFVIGGRRGLSKEPKDYISDIGKMRDFVESFDAIRATELCPVADLKQYRYFFGIVDNIESLKGLKTKDLFGAINRYWT